MGEVRGVEYTTEFTFIGIQLVGHNRRVCDIQHGTALKHMLDILINPSFSFTERTNNKSIVGNTVWCHAFANAIVEDVEQRR